MTPAPSRAFFVTGTDTGVGKTTVTAALAARLVRAGQRVAVLKPVETGCMETAAGLWAADAELLRAAAGGTQSAEDTCVYRFRTPVAPAVAARREGGAIRAAAIEARVAALRDRRPDWLFVEGAGGLLVPVTEDLLMADLAARLGLPLLIVARDGLGTINHTLLTVEVARARGLEIAGVILSATSPDPGPGEQDNAGELARLSAVPYLGRLAWIAAGTDPAELAHAIDLAPLG
ncbi:MAG TPA: dethiobiotin synthase [Kofleriaceae bacterium]|nr:dethiobiotin synthase [Kofleriaceae bacterium]